jgi:hypothetical protein
MGGNKNAYKTLVGKFEGNRPLGRPTHRWEGIIRKDLKEMGGGGGRCGLDASGSAKGPEAGPSEYGNESSGSIKKRGIS